VEKNIVEARQTTWQCCACVLHAG